MLTGIVRCAAVGLALAVSATVPAAPPPSKESRESRKPEARFLDKENHYSFQPPAGWKRKTDLPKPIVAFLAPAEKGFATNFSVNLYSKPVKPEDEEKFIRDVKVEYSKHGKIYEMKPIRLAGQPARAWRTKLNVPNYPPLENRQVICIYQNRVYELTYTMLPATMKKYDPIFDKLLASFAWEK